MAGYSKYSPVPGDFVMAHTQLPMPILIEVVFNHPVAEDQQRQFIIRRSLVNQVRDYFDRMGYGIIVRRIIQID
uniref:MurNAc-LAA domain-containing protein n=1 Tax=Caenorhabditis tropicalis TaxID=1561998 RepID=A0A1I7TN68_9PELO